MRLIARGEHLEAIRRDGLRVRSVQATSRSECPRRILIGEKEGTTSDRVRALVDACTSAGIDAEARTDIRRSLWDKLAFICAQAGLTATVRLPIGEIRDIEEPMASFRRIVDEVNAVAEAEGVTLSEDVVDRHEGFARSLEPGSSSSLHDVLVGRRRMELEAQHGSFVRRGAALGVPTPMCEAVYAILRPWEARNARSGRDTTSD